MKILIISDTHGRHTGFDRILQKEGAPDMLIHLGDVEGGEYYMSERVAGPVHMVGGNNDFFSGLNREEEFMIGKYRVLITHGHYYYVSVGTERIKEEARARGVDIVMFGHTHRPVLEVEEDLVTLNPGSVSFPRQEGRKPSYMIMYIGEDGEARFEQKFL